MSEKTKETGKVELRDDQLDDARGGAWYAKFEGVDGSSESSSRYGGGGGAGKVSMQDFNF